jgi:hypothetical protein
MMTEWWRSMLKAGNKLVVGFDNGNAEMMSLLLRTYRKWY